ncbi:uncharacterized protein O3C94_014515 [Discoglossus pictus]
MALPPDKRNGGLRDSTSIAKIVNNISQKFLDRSDVARLLRIASSSQKYQTQVLVELDTFFISNPQAKIKLVFVQDILSVNTIFVMSPTMQEIARKFPKHLYVDLLSNICPGFNLYSVSCEDDISGWKMCAACISRTKNQDTLRFLIVSVLQSIPKMKAQIKTIILHPAIGDYLDIGRLIPEITIRYSFLLLELVLEEKCSHLQLASQTQIKTVLHTLLHTRSLKIYNRYLNEFKAICPAEIFQYYVETWHKEKLWCIKDNKILQAEQTIPTYVTSLHSTIASEISSSPSLKDCLHVLLSYNLKLESPPAIITPPEPLLEPVPGQPTSPGISVQTCKEEKTNGLECMEFSSWEDFNSFLNNWCEEQKTNFVIRQSVPLTDDDMSPDLIQSLKYSTVILGCSSDTSPEKIDCPASIILGLGPKRDRLVVIEEKLVHNHKLSELEFSHYTKRHRLEASMELPIHITNYVSKRFLSPDIIWSLEDYSKAKDQGMCDLLKELDLLFKDDSLAKVKFQFQEDAAVLNSILISTFHMGNMVESFPRVLYLDKVLTVNEEFELYTVLCQDANGNGRECAYCISRMDNPGLVAFIWTSLVQSVPSIQLKVKCLTTGASITDVDSLEEVLPSCKIQVCRTQVLEDLNNKAKLLEIPKLEKIKSLLYNLAYSDSAKSYMDILSDLESVCPVNFLQYFLEKWHKNKSMWVECWAFEKNLEYCFMNHMNIHIQKLHSILNPPLSLSVCVRGLLDLQKLKSEVREVNLDNIIMLYRSACSTESASQIEEELSLAKHGFYDLKETANGFSLDGGICSFTVNKEMTCCSCTIYTTTSLPCRHLFAARLWTGQSLFDASLIEHTFIRNYNDKPTFYSGPSNSSSPRRQQTYPLPLTLTGGSGICWNRFRAPMCWAAAWAQAYSCNPSNSRSTMRWKVAGAFFIPKGMTGNWYRPNGVANADLGMASLASGICQYPLQRSIVVRFRYACPEFVRDFGGKLGALNRNNLLGKSHAGENLHQRIRNRLSVDIGQRHRLWHLIPAKPPPMPETSGNINLNRFLQKMDPDEDVEAFLLTFERIAIREEWPQSHWASIVAPYLCGEAHKAYFDLNTEQVMDYSSLKAEILARVGVTRSVRAQRFHSWWFVENKNRFTQMFELLHLAQRWLHPETNDPGLREWSEKYRKPPRGFPRSNSSMVAIPEEYWTYCVKNKKNKPGRTGGHIVTREGNGEEHPVLFLSRKLMPREQKYSVVEQECLPIKWSTEALRYYLLGRRFTCPSTVDAPEQGEKQSVQDSNMALPPDIRKNRSLGPAGIAKLANDISQKFLDRSDLARLLRIDSSYQRDQILVLSEVYMFFICNPQARIKLVFVQGTLSLKNIFIMSPAMQGLAQKFPKHLYVDFLSNICPGFNLYSVSCEDEVSGWKMCAACISKTNNPDTIRFLIVSVLQSIPKMKAHIKTITIHPSIGDSLDIATLLPEITIRHCFLLLELVLEQTFSHLPLASQAQIKTVLHILLHTCSLKVYNRYLNEFKAICPAEIFQYYFETWHPRRKLWCITDNKILQAEKTIYTYATSLHYTLASEIKSSPSLKDCLHVVLNDNLELKSPPAIITPSESLPESIPGYPTSPEIYDQICKEEKTNGLECMEFSSWEDFNSFLNNWCEEQKTNFVIRQSVPLTDDDMSPDLIQSLKYSTVNLRCGSDTSQEKIDCPASIILGLGPKRDRLVVIEAKLVHNHKLPELEFSHYSKRHRLEASMELPINITNYVSKCFLSHDIMWSLEEYSKAKDQGMCDLLNEVQGLFKDDSLAKVKFQFQEDAAVLNSIFISTFHMGNMVESFPRVLYLDKVLTVNEEFELYTVLCQDANGNGRECAYCILRKDIPDLVVSIVTSLVQSVPSIQLKVKCLTTGASITDVDSLHKVLPSCKIQVCRTQVLEDLNNKAKLLEIPKLEKIKSLLYNLAYSDSAKSYMKFVSDLQSVCPVNFLQYFLEKWHQSKRMWVECWAFEKNLEYCFTNHMNFHIQKLHSVLNPPLSLSVCVRGLLDLQKLKSEVREVNLDNIIMIYRSACSAESASQIEEELSLAMQSIYDFKETANGFSLNGGICSFTVNKEMTTCSCIIYTTTSLPCRHLFAARLWTGQSLYDGSLIEHTFTKNDDKPTF